MKNKTQTATQQLLKSIEDQEIDYKKDMLPKCLGSIPKDVKVGLRSHQIPEDIDRRQDTEGDLLPQLEHDKAEYDKFFGSETTKSKTCLVCREKPISIVFLNCGHMVICHHCLPKMEENCPICKNPIIRAIKTLVDENATLENVTRVKDKELSEHFEKSDRMSVIKENSSSETSDDDIEEYQIDENDSMEYEGLRDLIEEQMDNQKKSNNLP